MWIFGPEGGIEWGLGVQKSTGESKNAISYLKNSRELVRDNIQVIKDKISKSDFSMKLSKFSAFRPCGVFGWDLEYLVGGGRAIRNIAYLGAQEELGGSPQLNSVSNQLFKCLEAVSECLASL